VRAQLSYPPPLIRQAMLQDVHTLAEIDRRIVEDGRGVLRSEDQSSDVAWYSRRISEALAHPDASVLLVAEYAGEVVAEGSARRMGVAFCQHVASVALQVAPSAQRRGIGRAVMSALLDWASAKGCARVQLDVVSDNQRAMDLYTSLHFAMESSKVGYVRRPSGTVADDIVMVRFLEPPRLNQAAVALLRSQQGQQEILMVDSPLGYEPLRVPLPLEQESPALAPVLQEVQHQTGLAVGLERSLGWWTQLGPPPSQEPQRWHGLLLRCAGGAQAPGRWFPLSEALLHYTPPAAQELVRRALRSQRG
jgi:GNAT superfamily N-acetyltransferase